MFVWFFFFYCCVFFFSFGYSLVANKTAEIRFIARFPKFSRGIPVLVAGIAHAAAGGLARDLAQVPWAALLVLGFRV